MSTPFSTLHQDKVLAIVPKISAPLSMFGSFFILYESFMDIRNGQQQLRDRKMAAMNRVLMGFSIIDFFTSWAWFMSTWMAPKGTKVFAIGNQFTCNVQGFILYLAVGAPLYSGALNLLYLLLIRYHWTEAQFRRLEPWLHGFVWIFAFGAPTIMFMRALFSPYVPFSAVCLVDDPFECFDPNTDPLPHYCGRWWRLVLGLFLVPVWASMLVSLFCLTSLYLFVRRTRRRMQRYRLQDTSTTLDSDERGNTNSSTFNFSGMLSSGPAGVRRASLTTRNNNSNREEATDRHTRQVAIRGCLYAGAFLITYIWSSIVVFLDMAGDVPFEYWATTSFMEPLQGFWNFLIFCHNRPQSRAKLAKIFPCVTGISKFVSSLTSSTPSREDSGDTPRNKNKGIKNAQGGGELALAGIDEEEEGEVPAFRQEPGGYDNNDDDFDTSKSPTSVEFIEEISPNMSRVEDGDNKSPLFDDEQAKVKNSLSNNVGPDREPTTFSYVSENTVHA